MLPRLWLSLADRTVLVIPTLVVPVEPVRESMQSRLELEDGQNMRYELIRYKLDRHVFSVPFYNVGP